MQSRLSAHIHPAPLPTLRAPQYALLCLCLRYMLPPFDLWVYKQIISDIYINSCYNINRIASVRRRVLTLSKNGSDSSVPSDTVWPNKRGSYPGEGVNWLLSFFILSNHLDSTRVVSPEWLRPNGYFVQQKGLQNDDGKGNRAADFYYAWDRENENRYLLPVQRIRSVFISIPCGIPSSGT